MKQMVYGTDRAKAEVLHSGKYDGYDFIIVSFGTHPCAYVNVPKSHEYFGKDYDDIDIDVHGGLTYSNEGVSGTDIEGWWIGWDYAHHDDWTGFAADLSDKWELHKWTTEAMFEHVKSVVAQLKAHTK